MALAAFLNYLQVERRLAPVTCAAYACDLNQFAAFLAGVPLSCAEASHLQRFVADLRRANLRSSTLNRKVGSLRSFYQFLQRTGEIELDPSVGLARPASPPRRSPVLSVEQVQRLLKMPDVGTPVGLCDLTLIVSLYATGLRAAELLASNCEDIDFERSKWRLTGSRSLPLDGQLHRQLANYVRLARPLLLSNRQDPALFVAHGKRLGVRSLQIRLAHYGIGPGPRVTPQVLRNSYAAHLLAGGADLNVVQVLLGHQSAVATRNYSPLAAERLRRVYDQAHPRSRLSRSDP